MEVYEGKGGGRRKAEVEVDEGKGGGRRKEEGKGRTSSGRVGRGSDVLIF